MVRVFARLPDFAHRWIDNDPQIVQDDWSDNYPETYREPRRTPRTAQLVHPRAASHASGA
jgi:hypothetical protein